MNQRLKLILEEQCSFSPNKNQLRELERLIFEIMRREYVSQKTILGCIIKDDNLKAHHGKNKFIYIKNALIKRRFPLSSQKLKINAKDVFLPNLSLPLEDNYAVKEVFHPESIYIEKSVNKSSLADNFKNRFPDVEIIEIERSSDYLEKNNFQLSHLKKPIVFIVKEKWDFIKPCPCTKNHLNCGYWIFNLGFGCPFDCSYCFLQQYSNFPGLTLPANIDDFFDKFDHFQKKLKTRIRIGTGEFCDSLALDHITEYSKKLIPYFSKKNVIFELKTKSANIKNILETKASDNIVISWSLNPVSLVDSQELGAASLGERLNAAKQVQDAGYRIGFHFDPIIHTKDWQVLYKDLIDTLYAQLKGPFAWISLGTLRCHRKLKIASEQRFPKSTIFWDELLLAKDKKLRYPAFIRKDIYRYINACINEHDKKTPVYLCMEDKDNWNILGDKYNSGNIGKYILGN
jgi:DNA repair photolyase